MLSFKGNYLWAGVFARNGGEERFKFGRLPSPLLGRRIRSGRVAIASQKSAHPDESRDPSWLSAEGATVAASVTLPDSSAWVPTFVGMSGVTGERFNQKRTPARSSNPHPTRCAGRPPHEG